jgi:hypothetical protein
VPILSSIGVSLGSFARSGTVASRLVSIASPFALLYELIRVSVVLNPPKMQAMNSYRDEGTS